MARDSWERLFGKIAYLGLALVLAALAASAWFSNQNTRELAQNELRVEHTYDVLSDLDGVLVTVLNAETGVRGYLLTGERRFLQPYEKARGGIGQRLARLANDTADNDEQQKRLRPLRAAIVDHLQSLAQTLAVRAGSDGTEVPVRRLDREKSAVDLIRDLVAAMRQEEVSLLSKRVRTSSDRFYATRVIFVATAAATMLLVLATHALLRLDITGRRRANAELKQANERLREDLQAAARVQESLLPPPALEMSGLKFAWAFQPCEELAGDALNICPLADGQVGVYLLDVSGHGAAASLLAVSVIEALSPAVGNGRLTLGVELPIQPAEVARELDQRFVFDDAGGRFFTMLYGVIDPRTLEFRYVSAAHPPPIHLAHQAQPVLLDANIGLPIGLRLGGDYRHSAIHLAPEDRLYLYSDGVTESMNGNGELFGTARLLTIVEECRDRNLQASIDGVLDELRQWRAGARQQDDVSLLAVEVNRRR